MTNRPSDAVTGEVVARWKGWENINRDPGIPPYGPFYFGDVIGRDEVMCPLDDTDAALELLHAIGVSIDPNASESHWWTPTNRVPRGSLTESEWRALEYLPISGEPFRYAVVRLAARVWGIEE